MEARIVWVARVKLEGMGALDVAFAVTKLTRKRVYA